MRIAITAGLGARGETTGAGLVQRARELESAGIAGMWLPTAFGLDALSAFSAIAAATGRIELGTAVVPTFPRHPVVMAQQARTVQSFAGGRFTLGIGLSHRVMIEDGLGIPYEKPARHMEEYLSVLTPLLRGEAVSFRGKEYRVDASVTIAGHEPVPVLVAALGPAMLRLAGRLADGTITSWVGANTLAGHIAPRIQRAAQEAGRPSPRIAVGLPIVVTDAAAEARAQISRQAAWYASLPSYAAMFEREGASGPGDVAVAGTAAEVDAQLEQLEAAGATDFLAQLTPVEPGAVERTYEYLVGKAARR